MKRLLTLNTDGTIYHIRFLFYNDCFCGIKREELNAGNVQDFDLFKYNVCPKCKAEYVKKKLLGWELRGCTG